MINYNLENKRDKKLIQKIKKNSQKAFKELYEVHGDYALRTAYAISKNKNDASDIVQETFIKIFKNIDNFDENKPFKPWFYRILINESNRYMAKKAKDNASEQEIENSLELSVEDEYQEKNIELEQALEKLDEINRTPIILKYLNNLSEKEIAEALDLNINTVKSRLYKGREKLRKLMGRSENE